MGIAAMYSVQLEMQEEQLREEWKTSMSLPRKKKKKVRKDLMFRWGLLQYVKQGPDYFT